MYVFSFEKLDVWQNSREFIFDIYKITMKFPQMKFMELPLK